MSEPKENPSHSGGEIRRVKLDLIDPNPYQARKKFAQEELKELAKSIQENGILQPITVRQKGERYEIVVGERRMKAAKLAGLKEISVILREIEEENTAILSLIENLQRENLGFFEEAEGYKLVIDNFSLTQAELGNRIGKKQSTIANKLRLLKLPKAIRELVMEKGLGERHARALLKLTNEHEQKELCKIMANRSLSASNSEKLVKKRVNQSKDAKGERIKIFTDIRLFLNSIHEVIKELKLTGTDVTIQEVDNEEKIEIKIQISKNKWRC